MSTSTIETPMGIVERARETVASRTILIRSDKNGVIPMERRLADGTKNVSRCEYNQFGKMMGARNVRPLDFGRNGTQIINPADPDDVALLEECKLWLAHPEWDGRITKYNVRIVEGGSNAEGEPFEYYDRANVKTIIERIASTLEIIGDAPEDAQAFLEKVARYELQREKPRKMILDAVDDLGVAAGVEYGTDAVDEL